MAILENPKDSTTLSTDLIANAKLTIPGADILGKSIDILSGRIIDNSGWTKDLKNVTLFQPWTFKHQPNHFDKKYRVPDQLRAYLIHSMTEFTAISKDLYGYYQELRVNFQLKGKYKYFKGMVESNFDHKLVQSGKFYLATYSKGYEYFSLNLDGTPSILQGYLKANVKNDIDTMDPLDLFKYYGTHIITDISVGGKVSISCLAKKSAYQDKEEVAMAVKGEMDLELAEIFAKTTVNFESKAFPATIQSSNGRQKYGALPPSAPLKPGQKIPIVDEHLYKKEVQNSPLALGPTSDGLVPIWELASSDSRKTVLIDAFEMYCDQKGALIKTPVIYGFYTDVKTDLSGNGPKTYCYPSPTTADFHKLSSFSVFTGRSLDKSNPPHPSYNWPTAYWRFACNEDTLDWDEGVTDFIFNNKLYRLRGGYVTQSGNVHYEWGIGNNRPAGTTAPAVTVLLGKNYSNPNHSGTLTVHWVFQEDQTLNPGDSYYCVLGGYTPNGRSYPSFGIQAGMKVKIIEGVQTWTTAHQWEEEDFYLICKDVIK